MKENRSRILLENLYIVPMTEPIITLSRVYYGRGSVHNPSRSWDSPTAGFERIIDGRGQAALPD